MTYGEKVVPVALCISGPARRRDDIDGEQIGEHGGGQFCCQADEAGVAAAADCETAAFESLAERASVDWTVGRASGK